jgi:hypothetical protein
VRPFQRSQCWCLRRASLPNDLADRVRNAATAAGVSVSAIITSAVAEFLGASVGNV